MIPAENLNTILLVAKFDADVVDTSGKFATGGAP
jgi:hypothetical protein